MGTSKSHNIFITILFLIVAGPSLLFYFDLQRTNTSAVMTICCVTTLKLAQIIEK